MKKDINPTDIIVGIKTLKTLRDGRILIETCSEEELNSLIRAINTKCGEQLEIMKHKLRKSRIIIYNFPEEIAVGNVTTVIKAQNSETTLNGEDITAKFRYKTRKGNYNTYRGRPTYSKTNPSNQTENRVGNMQSRRLHSTQQML